MLVLAARCIQQLCPKTKNPFQSELQAWLWVRLFALSFTTLVNQSTNSFTQHSLCCCAECLLSPHMLMVLWLILPHLHFHLNCDYLHPCHWSFSAQLLANAPFFSSLQQVKSWRTVVVFFQLVSSETMVLQMKPCPSDDRSEMGTTVARFIRAQRTAVGQFVATVALAPYVYK